MRVQENDLQLEPHFKALYFEDDLENMDNDNEEAKKKMKEQLNHLKDLIECDESEEDEFFSEPED